MSGAYLRLATYERLEKKLALNKTQVGMRPGPQPIPGADQIYIAIHPSSVSTIRTDRTLRREFSLQVTISITGTKFIKDLWGETVIGIKEDAIEFVADRVIAQIHDSIDLIVEANDLVPGPAAKFLAGTPFKLQSASDFIERDPSWWGRAAETQGPEGMSQTLLFGGVERFQAVGELDPLVVGV